MGGKPRIRGEKIFTAAVRADAVAKCQQAAKKLRTKADRIDQRAAEIEAVETTQDLEKIVSSGRVGDPARLDVYCRDYRSTCVFCGRKSHGGVGGLVGLEFVCMRDACDKKLDVSIAKDRREHPENWVRTRRRIKRKQSKPRSSKRRHDGRRWKYTQRKKPRI